MRREKFQSSAPILKAFPAVLLLLFLSAPLLESSDPPENIRSKVEAYIGALVRMGKFSGSVLIAQIRNVPVSKGYGMANYEHDVPNTPRTIFRIGSITKQFTVAAAMWLQERGMLKVDDP